MRQLSLLKFVMGALIIWACSGGGDGGSPTEPTQPTVNPPTVQNIEITTAEDTSASFVFVGSDATGAAVTFSIVDNPVNGSITLNGNGGIYNPNANYYGGDTFSYKATSVNGVSNTATATISITSVNDTPNTSDASATTDEDTTVEITLSATDIENDDLTFNVKNNPSNGTVSISANIATYTPNQDWNGTDTFNFEAVDSNNRTILNTATATIVVNPVNDAPVANNMTVSTDENRFSQLSITLDASDVDNDNLTYSIASDVSNGETSLNGNIVTYTPSQDWNGEDVFTFLVNDGTADSNTASVTITVNAINDAPVTVNQTASTNEDEPISITLTATDIDSDTFSYSLESNTSNGTINLSNDVVTYTPNTNWSGTDTFTFKANDGTDDSNTSTVSITVDAVNDAPEIEDTTLSTFTNHSSGSSIELSATDIDGDSSLTFSVVDEPTKGTATINGSTLTYIPENNYAGLDSLTYKVNDGELDSELKTIEIAVKSFGQSSIEFKKDVSNGINNSWVEASWGNLDLDPITSNAQISLSMWIKPDRAFQGSFISRFQDSNFWWSIDLNSQSSGSSTNIYFRANWNGLESSNSFSSSFDYNEWNHIGITIDTEGRLTLYVNGVYIDDSFPVSQVEQTVENITGNIIFGLKESGGTDRQYIGLIDEVFIVRNNILSNQQFSDIYNNGNGLNDISEYLSNLSNDIIGYWRFNEGTGTSTTDESSNNFTTTLNGGATWSVVD